jgi:uncharacterized membrane protein
MLVVVFDDESRAYEGAKALRELHAEGSISVYSAAVVARDTEGKIAVKDAGDEGPIGTAIGMMTGALVGMFGGPAGVVFGTATGGLMGATADLFNFGFGADYVDEVSDALEPGKVAVVAEVGETWVTPLDTRMEELGGTVIRRYRVDVEDEQLAREIAAAQADYDALIEEMAQSNEENREKIKAKAEAAKAKLVEVSEKAQARQQNAKQELDAKLEAIDKQIDAASADAKENLEKRKAELKKQRKKRLKKLNKAWEKTKESLAA